jgi:hypothetical protein
MKPTVVRFLFTVVLFLGWLSYLAVQVWSVPNPIVLLSRPQFLVSQLDVVARISGSSVTIEQKLFPKGDDSESDPKVGAEIKVANLSDCRPPGTRDRESPPDWKGDGLYILALQPSRDGKSYTVVPTPPSPGFLFGTPRIYPADGETLAQYRSIAK